MNNDTLSSLKDQRERHNSLMEVSNKEKQLWLLIHTKGLLQTDVQELYRKVRSSYEKMILNDYEQLELQDVEYSLWKLHYKHIDEFRKRIKKSSTLESSKSGEPHDTNHIEGFKLFLSEAAEFYQNLIVKIRKCYGLPEESSFYKKSGISNSFEPKKIKKCQFLCHRFLVCLGDLARYKEQNEKPDVHNHKWSMAASHYMEATAIWPDSGNPQNQLAVLATYIGDEFLALYHCIRSLAVKEPFPDAWDNLLLLLERNRSSPLQSLSSEAQFNFIKPYERSITKTNSKSIDHSSCRNNGSAATDFWSLFIRIISFFVVKPSLDEFPSAFTSVMRGLDALLALDDTELKASLESYQHMDSIKAGPFRALQVVSIFLYTLQSLINCPQIKHFEEMSDTQLILLRQLALTSLFIFMGRFVERCLKLKAGALSSCPLLPAVLVFVEWLATMLNEAEKYGVDRRSSSAMSYFFESFVALLNRLGANNNEGNTSVSTPLWEDYELRGFAPVTRAHESLYFSSHWEHIDNFEEGTKSRCRRIRNAGLKIANRSNDSQKWIIYDQSGGNFRSVPINSNAAEFNENVESISSDLKTDASDQNFCEGVEEFEGPILEENPSVNGKSVTVEEEEVILFKPLTRYNSAPLCTNSNEPTSPKEMEEQAAPPDDCLRRATSLLIAQNQAQGGTTFMQTDISNFRHNKPFKQQELVFKEATMLPPFPDTLISSGPPSLSAWVLERGGLINNKEKAASGIHKHILNPIEEMASESLCGLSITQNQDSSRSHDFLATHYSSSPYSAPTPSAPLLPDDAAWFTGLQSRLQPSEGINGTETLSNASQGNSSYPNWNATQGPTDLYGLSSIPGLAVNYTPQRRMTSSEWLRQYRENHAWPWPSYFYAPGNIGNSDNPLASNPTVHMESPPLYPPFSPDYAAADAQRREKLLYGYLRPSPFVCGAVTDMRSEPQPLLQYLKEKERQLQFDPTTLMRGPTYMGN
ncbi:protein SMG7L [Morus notabilis]|nr:protein SMG7L [Morus notabilis]XP_024029115.1 protein SMG7L [Morus notabilis]